MKFQHKIPVLYYSGTEDLSNDRYELELKTLRTKFPDYNILTSKELFKNQEEWEDQIDAVINSSDIVVFSFSKKMEWKLFL